MRRLLYANLVTRTPASRDGQTLDFPAFVAGEQVTFGLRFLDDIAGSLVETKLDVVSIRAGVGRRDAAPARGTFALKIGSGTSTSANTTPPLQFNASPQTVATALNALSGGTEDYAVTMDGPDYLIRRNGGETFTIAGDDNNLEPSSFVRVRTFTRDGAQIHRIRLVQAPVAFTDAFDLIVPTAPSIALVRDGGSDPSNTYFWNEIHALTVPADFRGTYQLKRGYARTRLLDSTDGPDEIAEALNAILTPEGGSVAVTNPQSQVANIEFRGDLAGTNVGLLEVTVFNAPAGDPTFVLNFNTQEVFRELSAAEAVPLVFELEVTARSVPGDEESDTRVIKLWSVPVVLARPVNWEGLAAAQNIDWLRPPGPRNYIPFTTDQILTGQQQAFSAVIGDGTETEFVIDHNLDSELCQVVVRENEPGGRLVRPDEYEVILDTADSLTITFTLAAPPADSLAVFVVAIGPESVFQAHTHTMEQINGLDALLEDLGERLEAVEAVLPSTGPGATASSTVGLISTIPEVSEILGYRGTDAETLLSEPGKAAAELRASRAPAMLPAAHDASLSTVTSAPTISSTAGSVFTWDSATPLDVGGDLGIRAATVLQGEIFASDGRLLYPVRRSGITTSYFPTNYERTLFAMAVNDKMLALNRTLQILFGVQTQMIHATAKAQWVLSVQIGTFSATSSPSTTGLNLEAVTWAAPVFEQPIVLSRLLQSHFFGIRIKRLAGSLSLDQQLYGVWAGNNSAAPASANFAIRARLDRFDTENVTDPRGYVAYRLIGSAKTDEEGKQTILPAQAIIS
jgi:hypothetical protein